MDARTRRIAQNEARFREINDRLEDHVRSVADDEDVVEYVCECGHLHCQATVRMTRDEYNRVRRDARTFTVVPGHEIADVEDILERHPAYSVIRKHADANPVVERHRPTD